jgi:hypothetical protein
VPIFKAGDPSLCDNYRPISLVKTLSKILEKIFHIRLVNHLEINKLIYNHQYGFLRGKSTEQNLIHVIDTIGHAFNNSQYCIGVFLDLKKEFDVCDHEILLAKLKKYGITNSAHDWFESYLSGREQKTDINGSLSGPSPVDISVIQGSILGPTLFLIYINDFHNATSLKTFLFADDTSALKAGNDFTQLFDDINNELRIISRWFRANKMAVNTTKTKYIIFHTKGKIVNTQGFNLFFDDNDNDINIDPSKITILERVHSNNPNPSSRTYKLLGINFDENMNLNVHISLLL